MKKLFQTSNTVSESENAVDTNTPNKDNSRLRNAMSAADKRIEQSEQLHADAANETLEKQIAVQLEQEFNAELAENVAQSAIDAVQDEDAKASGSSEARASARVLEIQEKQKLFKTMTSKIRENGDVLLGIAKQAEHMAAYLEKSESDLITLEEKDAKLAKVTKAAVELAHKYKKANQTIAGQKKNLFLLEGQNKNSFEALENTKLELARLDDTNAALNRKISEQDTFAQRLVTEKQSLVEKAEVIQSESDNIASELSRVQLKLEEALQQNKKKELQITKNEQALAELTEQNEQRFADINDLQSRYASLRDSKMEKETELQNAQYEAKSVRKELEEKLRLKQGRIQELEAKIEVAEKHLTLTEERVSALAFDLEAAERMNTRTLIEKDAREQSDFRKPIKESGQALEAAVA